MLEERDLGETHVLAAFIGVSEMVGNLQELREVLKSVVRIAPQLTRVDRCAIFLYDAAERTCVPAEAYSPRPALAEALLARPLAEAEAPRLLNKVVHQKLPTVVRDLPQEEMLPQEFIQAWELKSMLVIPLVSKGQTQGIMTLDSTTSRHYFTSKEINIVTGIANQVATAIENGKLQQEAHRAFQKIGAAVEEVADAVVRVDGGMRVIGLSPQGEKFLRWREKDLTGKPWTKQLKPQDHDGRRLEEMDFMGSGPLVNGELSAGKKVFVLKGNKGKVFCKVQVLPLRGAEGGSSHLLFVFNKAPIPKKREAAREAG